MNKVLVIAAHPDDEALGVGGTMLKHIHNGDKVSVCILTKAYAPQWSKKYQAQVLLHQKKFDNFLGVTERINLDLPTVRLNTLPYGETNKKVSEAVARVKPNIIYTHHLSDINSDHKITFDSAMVASRPPLKINVFCFETLSETEWGHESFKPNYYINIEPFITKKIKAFSMYKNEVKKFPHPRSPKGVKILAAKRGSEICAKYAEAFTTVRSYW